MTSAAALDAQRTHYAARLRAQSDEIKALQRCVAELVDDAAEDDGSREPKQVAATPGADPYDAKVDALKESFDANVDSSFYLGVTYRLLRHTEQIEPELLARRVGARLELRALAALLLQLRVEHRVPLRQLLQRAAQVVGRRAGLASQDGYYEA